MLHARRPRVDRPVRWYVLLLVGALLMTGCYDKNEYVVGGDDGVNIDDVITLSLSSDTVPADGASAVSAVADLNDRAAAGRTNVLFYVTHIPDRLGATATGTSTDTVSAVGTSKQAVLDLPAQVEPGVTVVTAVVAGIAVTDTVIYSVAPADSIEVSTGAVAIIPSYNTSTNLKAHLISGEGVASAGTVVRFAVHDSSGSSLGWIRNVTASGQGGDAGAEFVLGDTSYYGIAYVIASTDGGAVQGRDSMIVIPPPSQ